MFKRMFLGAMILIPTIINSQNRLTPEILTNFKRISGGKVSPDGKKVLFEMRTMNIEANNGNTDLFVIDLKTKKTQQLTSTPFSEMDAVWGKNNTIWFLSTEKDGVQLWKINEDGSGKIQVSSSEREIEGYKISHDESSIILISPVKSRPSLADKYPDLPKAEARLEDDLMYRHWNYWNDETKKHLFLHTITNNKISAEGKDLLENENVHGVQPPFGGSESITFSPDGKKIIYSTKKLNGKDFALSTNSELYEYDITSEKTRNITEGYKGYDNHPSFSVSGKYLAWLSMAHDGYEADKNDIILRELSTGKDKNLTKEHDITVDDFAISADEKTVYFISPSMGTQQIFSLDIKSGTIRQLTKGQFDFVSLEINTQQIIAGRQSMLSPTELFTIDLKTLSVAPLTEVNKEALSKLKLPSVEERWVETSDGKKMLVWMVLPPDFDAQKKYPALLYCQGGPQSMVSQFFSYRWNLALMASEGYIVIAPNRRGLPGFGVQWNEAISGDWGGQPIRDYLSATDYAAALPYVDADKMGAVGASYGGYSVYFLAGNHQKRFKTFISHCGLFNLESWYGTTEELFFANWDNKGPYWLPENKEYYQKNSPHRYVQNWDTPILVIHGGVDFRVPESEGMQAFQAAKLKGLRSKYLLFPKEGHWITTPQNGILWQREFFDWLKTDLKQ